MSGQAGPTFNIQTYGAKGDGVANDAPAVQTAIDAAVKAGGGTVYVPSGIYLLGVPNAVASTIYLRSHISLQGAGTTSILRKAAGGHSAPMFWNTGRELYEGAKTGPYAATGAGDSRITISDLTIDGNKGSLATWVGHTNQQGVWLSKVKDSTIHNVTFINCCTNGLALEYCKAVTVSKCVFADNLKNGLYLSGSQKITVDHCMGYDNGARTPGLVGDPGASFAVAASWYCSITDCITWGNTTAGLGVGRDTQFLTVADSYLDGIFTSVEPPGHDTPYTAERPGQPPYNGATGYGVSNSVFSGLTIRAHVVNRHKHGIVLLKGSGNVIKDCRILSADQNGILLHGISHSTIQGCKIWNVGVGTVNSQQTGIQITASATFPLGTGNVLKDNEIYDAQSQPTIVYGISISANGAGSVAGTKLDGNLIHAGAKAPLYVGPGVQVKQSGTVVASDVIADLAIDKAHPSEFYGTKEPAIGTYALNDRVWNVSPGAPGTPLFWVCTTPGTPGAWKPVPIETLATYLGYGVPE